MYTFYEYLDKNHMEGKMYHLNFIQCMFVAIVFEQK